MRAKVALNRLEWARSKLSQARDEVDSKDSKEKLGLALQLIEDVRESIRTEAKIGPFVASRTFKHKRPPQVSES